MLMMYATLAKHVFVSVARIVKLAGPDEVGVPESTPALVSVRPAGSVPMVTENVYGAAPPLPVSVSAYAIPSVPPGSVAGASVIVGQTGGGAAAMVIEYEVVATQSFASVARIVNVDGPAVVGVPDRTPVLESVSPAGRVPTVTANAYGVAPPLPTIV